MPTEKAYEEIKETTLPDFTTGFSEGCVNFLKRIFETVSNKNNNIVLEENYFTLSAKELLEDPWLNNGGGKGRTKRKNKKSNNLDWKCIQKGCPGKLSFCDRLGLGPKALQGGPKDPPNTLQGQISLKSAQKNANL